MQMESQVKDLIIECLHLEELSPSDIGDEDPLFGDDGLGLDSVDALELAISIERKFGVKIEDNEKSREVMHSVRSLSDHIQSRSGS